MRASQYLSPEDAESLSGFDICRVQRQAEVVKGSVNESMRPWLSLIMRDITRHPKYDYEDIQTVTTDVWAMGGRRTLFLPSVEATCPTWYRSWLSHRGERLCVLVLPNDVALGDGTYDWQGVQFWTLKVGASSEDALARLTVLAKLAA